MNESFFFHLACLQSINHSFTLVGLYSRMSFTVVMGMFVTSDNDFKLQTAFNLLFLIYYFQFMFIINYTKTGDEIKKKLIMIRQNVIVNGLSRQFTQFINYHV